MLQAIRGRAASWVVKILFILLILSFTAWGVADWLQAAQRPQVVAEIGPVRIDPAVFSQAVSTEMQRFRQVFGANFDRDQAKTFGIADRVIDQMVQKTLLELEAKRLGITVSDQMLRDAIRNNPSFKNERGEFDRYRFEAIINRAGYSEARFIEEMRRDLVRTQLMRPIAEGAEPAKAMAEALLRHRGERRVADTALVSFAAVGAIPAPDDTTLEAYLKASSARFMRPEYRTLSYLVLGPDVLMARVTIAEDDAKKAYEERVDEYTTPERRVVEQMTLPDEATAEKAQQEIAGGKSFLEVAIANGKTEADTKFGDTKRDELPAEFAGPVFELAQGGVTKPIKSAFGWHLFTVTAITPQQVEPYEAVKDKLIDQLKHEKAADDVQTLANKLEDALGGGTSLDEVAAKFDLPVRKTPPIEPRGTGTDGKPVADLPPELNLVSTGFSLAANQTSRLIEAKDDTYFAVRVDEITPTVLPPLADIREAVAAAWTQAERDKAAKAKADAMVEAIKGGAALEAAATAAGAELKVSAPFTRDGAGAQLPAGLAAQMFAGAVGTIGVAPTGDGYTVARVKEVLPIDPATEEAQLTKLKGELRQAIGNDLLQQFDASLRSRFSVSINQRAVEQAF